MPRVSSGSYVMLLQVSMIFIDLLHVHPTAHHIAVQGAVQRVIQFDMETTEAAVNYAVSNCNVGII